MTTATTVEARLDALGLHVPDAVETRFAYQPIIVDGTHAWLAGMLAKTAGDVVATTGVVGVDVELERARDAARDCALQALAWIRRETGTLDSVKRVLRMTGYVRVGPQGFDRMSEVIDAASAVFASAFGDEGRPVRSVVGVSDLPRHAAVMIDLVVAVG